MLATFARLAGLGAFGACGGLLALYVAFILFTLPGGTDGMDATTTVVSWIAGAGLTFALIVVHVMLGRRLLRLAQGESTRHPL